MTRTGLAKAVNELEAALRGDGDLEDAAERAVSRVSAHLDSNGPEERYESTARVRVKMTRGDGTRDSDEWVIEGRGADAGEAATEFDANLGRYEDEWGARVRGLDPQPED